MDYREISLANYEVVSQLLTQVSEKNLITILEIEKEESVPSDLISNLAAETIIMRYITDAMRQAIKKAKTDNTRYQHTVPKFIAKTFGYYSKNKDFSRKIDNKTIISNFEYSSLEMRIIDRELNVVNSEELSIHENIYDSPESLPSMEPKVVECFLSIVERDSASIIKSLVDNPHKKISWKERCILSSYALLQHQRTYQTKTIEEYNINEAVALLMMYDKNISEIEALEKIKTETGIGSLEFGARLWSLLSINNLNYFFNREWIFLKVPNGLVLSTEPFTLFDNEDEIREIGGIVFPQMLITPINRNVLWILEKRNNYICPLDRWDDLSLVETVFINSLLSEYSEFVICHPDDFNILNNINSAPDPTGTRWG